jgi:hypothetical protein
MTRPATGRRCWRAAESEVTTDAQVLSDVGDEPSMSASFGTLSQAA